MDLDMALDNRVVLSSPLDCAVQELDMLFNTESTELIGYPDFGVSMDQFLSILNPSVTEIRQYVTQKIYNNTYFCSKLNVDVQVQLEHDDNDSLICIVAITLTDGDQSTMRVYDYAQS